MSREDAMSPMNVLLELSKYFPCILFTSEAIHNFKLGKFDIDRIVVLAEEDLDIVLQY